MENLEEPLLTFVNPSWRFQESIKCFGIKHFTTLKWHKNLKTKKELDLDSISRYSLA